MLTDKIRKYILPNIPYLFIGWAFLKLGTAYRLAAGANAGEKLLGLMQTIGVALADFSPGLAPFDWLVGMQSSWAVAVRFRSLCRGSSGPPGSARPPLEKASIPRTSGR